MIRDNPSPAAVVFTVLVVLWVAGGLIHGWPVDAIAAGLGLAVWTGVLAQNEMSA